MPATGAVSFRITVLVENARLLPEIQARMADLSPFFDAVIDDWQRGVEGKFNRGRGQEQAGAEFTPAPTWEPLQSKEYVEQKRREGRENWLMVRTGDLKEALMQGQFFRMVEPLLADWGTPADPDDEVKVRGNWELRQALFFDSSDMQDIARNANDYMTLGPRFRDIKFADGVEKMRMDAEFQAAVGGGA